MADSPAASRVQARPPRPPRPLSRLGFEIVILCALPLEADAACALFDYYWDNDDDQRQPFGKAPNDPNAYTTGVIGRHNVVVAHLPGMGKVSGALGASNCSKSFPNIKLALVIGICGAVPFIPGSGNEVILGDVFISDSVIQHDFGQRLPDEFIRKDTLLHKLPRANVEIRSLLAKLKSIHDSRSLKDRTVMYLGDLQEKYPKMASYLGAEKDILFAADYVHTDREKSCEQIACNGPRVARERLTTIIATQNTAPAIHFGLMASGDIVIESGIHRDAMAEKEGVVAFETESAGVWDVFPCIVIKAACDYSDSHKTEEWQKYAASTAAACMKSFLHSWVSSSAHNDDTFQCTLPEPVSKPRVTLDMYVVHEAQYDSADTAKDAKCLENTRISIQNRILKWTNSIDGPNIFWLHGPAGTGKSTLARTIADKLASKDKLAGAYIFKRGNQARNGMSRIFTTLVNQIAEKVPSFDSYVSESITSISKDGLDHKALDAQFALLFAKPLHLFWNKTQRRLHKVIIIDALDECIDQQGTYTLLSLLPQLNTPQYRVNILVTSRLTADIEFYMNSLFTVGETLEFIDIQAEFIIETKQDVELYMRDSFEYIRKRARIMQTPWPTEQDLQILVSQATTPSPLFIYAASLFRYLQDSKLPVQKLKKWLDLSASASSNQLQSMYEPILKEAFLGFDNDEISDIEDIIRTIALAITPLSAIGVSTLLGISLETVNTALAELRTVVNYSTDGNAPISFYHKSFTDFLFRERDESSNCFRIDLPSAHSFLATKCLAEMRENLEQGISARYTSISDIPNSLMYSCQNWSQHIQQSHLLDVDHNLVESFLHTKLLNWIEILIFANDFQNAVYYIIQAEKVYQSTLIENTPIKSFLKDTIRFIPSLNDYIIGQPELLYSTALVFSPRTSIVRNAYWDGRPAYIANVRTTISEWPLILHSFTLNEDEDEHMEHYSFHTEPTLLTYSANGELLAHVNINNRIYIWNVISGLKVQSIFLSKYIYAVAFAPDCKSIAGAADDGSIYIWDLASGLVKQKIENCPTFLGPSITYDGDLSVCNLEFPDNGSAWDVLGWKLINIKPRLEREDIQVCKTGYNGNSHWFQVFSPDGTLAASPTPNNTVLIWNVYTGSLISSLALASHQFNIGTLAISPDNKMVFSHSASVGTGKDHEGFIWEITTGQMLYSFADKTTPNFIFFTPNSEHLLLDDQSSLCVWSRKTGQASQIKLNGVMFGCAAHSPTFTELALASETEIILWDMASDEQFIKLITISIPQDNSGNYGQSLPTRRYYDHPSINQSLPFCDKKISKMTISSKGAIAIRDVQHALEVIDIQSGNVFFAEPSCHPLCTEIQFSDNGERIAYHLGNEGIIVREMKQFSVLVSIPVGLSFAETVFAFSSDGTRLATATTLKSSVALWNVDTSTKFPSISINLGDWCFFSTTMRLSPSGDKVVFQKWDVSNPGVGKEDVELVCACGEIGQELWSTPDFGFCKTFTSDGGMVVVRDLMSNSANYYFAVLCAATGHCVHVFPVSEYISNIRWKCLWTELSVPSRQNYIKSALGYLNIQTGQLEDAVPGLEVLPIVYNNKRRHLEWGGEMILKAPNLGGSGYVRCYSWGNHIFLHFNRPDYAHYVHFEFSFPVGVIRNTLIS